MLRTPGKIALVCSLGSFIGTIIALEVNLYFWWIGVIVGGFVGYIFYDFQQVLRAIRYAWGIVKPDIQLIRAKILFLLAFLLLSVSLTIFCSLIMGILWLFNASSDTILGFSTVCLLFLFSILGSGLIVSFFGVVLCGKDNTANNFIRVSGELMLTNPVNVYCRLLPRAIRWVSLIFYVFLCSFIAGLPNFARTVVQFAVCVGLFFGNVFVFIHSDEKLLCGVDTAMGVTIGYFTGNALIGAIAGGLIGVVNFELISKRLLHLIPASNKP